MVKVKRSEYIVISRAISRTLFKIGCFGKGSLYLDNLAKGATDREFSKLQIKEIIKENGNSSIIPVLLML